MRSVDQQHMRIFAKMAVRFAGRSTVIARRVDYLADEMFAGKFDVNPRYRQQSSRAIGFFVA